MTCLDHPDQCTALAAGAARPSFFLQLLIYGEQRAQRKESEPCTPATPSMHTQRL
jgi:hypothetical protein